MRGFYICMDLNNATKFTGSQLSDPAEFFSQKGKTEICSSITINLSDDWHWQRLLVKSFGKFITFGNVLLQLLEIHCISVRIAAIRQKAF